MRGAALSGTAAENLEKAAGLDSRTLASWELGWKEGRTELSRREVLVASNSAFSSHVCQLGSRFVEQRLGVLEVSEFKA